MADFAGLLLQRAKSRSRMPSTIVAACVLHGQRPAASGQRPCCPNLPAPPRQQMVRRPERALSNFPTETPQQIEEANRVRAQRDFDYASVCFAWTSHQGLHRASRSFRTGARDRDGCQ